MISGMTRMVADRRGVSAVEFALIAPLMILMYLGTVEVAMVLMIDRKVTNVTSTIGDLVSRTEDVSESELEEIFKAGGAVMEPYDDAGLEMQVYSVVLEDAEESEYCLDWQQGSASTVAALTDAPGIPENLLTVENTGILVAKASYEYTPPFSRIFSDSIVLGSTLYFSPRKSMKVSGPDEECD